MFNMPSTPDSGPNIPPWSAYGSQGEEYFSMTPDALTIDASQQHAVFPWDFTTASMCSSTTGSWGYDQTQAMAEDHLSQMLQNIDCPPNPIMDWSGTNGADLYHTPQGTQYSHFGTMVLEDVEPDIISRVMSVLIESKSPVKIRLCQ